MKIDTLDELFADELFDMLDAERTLVKELPKMAEAAHSPKLAQAFRSHLLETEGHVGRLEKVLEILDIKEKTEKCDAIHGLVKEAHEMVKRIKKGPVLDAGLITAAQKVEHYEIASYGTLAALAKTLGHTAAEKILRQTLDEEKSANSKLTEIAEASVNEVAGRVAA